MMMMMMKMMMIKKRRLDEQAPAVEELGILLCGEEGGQHQYEYEAEILDIEPEP